MVFLLPRRVRDKLRAEPLPPPDSFQGQTVLITGATSGLGLAAAVHFANLGANLVLTARSIANGHTAAEQVEACAGIVGQGRIQVLELDMSRYSSCVSFVSQLKQQTANCARQVDVAVLNAGLINVDFKLSPEGWYVQLLSGSHFNESSSDLVKGANNPSEHNEHHAPGTSSTRVDGSATDL